MTKFYVYWCDLMGKKHRTTIYAANSYLAASLCRLKYDSRVDLIVDVREVMR